MASRNMAPIDYRLEVKSNTHPGSPDYREFFSLAPVLENRRLTGKKF